MAGLCSTDYSFDTFIGFRGLFALLLMDDSTRVSRVFFSTVGDLHDLWDPRHDVQMRVPCVQKAKDAVRAGGVDSRVP